MFLFFICMSVPACVSKHHMHAEHAGPEDSTRSLEQFLADMWVLGIEPQSSPPSHPSSPDGYN